MLEHLIHDVSTRSGGSFRNRSSARHLGFIQLNGDTELVISSNFCGGLDNEFESVVVG